ncbi:MAG: phosphoglycerate dehydrogenase [Luteitalea sp.]|nr:phosphoglycerate dehydrogenase [Luteitalea sp.]
MKIIVADNLPASAVDLLRAVDGWTVDTLAGRARSELLTAMATADALLVRSATKVDRELLEAAPALRIVARAGTGVDNVDLDVASTRGIMVTNAPGVNSVSVAEHVFALMLSLARRVPVADGSMKQHRWEKKALLGAELRGKTLGIVGLGRIGQEVAHRARVFGMSVVAYDPFIPTHVAADMGVRILALDELCSQADFITLHVPVTEETRRLFSREQLVRCKAGACLINTARGELIDEAALLELLESGHLGGAGLDVYEKEPPGDWQLVSHSRVVATPHIAASTSEAQELVGLDVAEGVRDYLLHGVVRNAVNFPSVPAEEFAKLQPWMSLAERLGICAAQLATGPIQKVGIRYYGQLAEGPRELITGSVLVGVFRHILSAGTVTLVNARALAADRGVEVLDTRSTRARDFTSLVSVKLHTSDGEQWLEGTIFEHGGPRIVLLNGVGVEAPIEGTLIVIENQDRPGVIGEVGTCLGRHAINIATFALGRTGAGAVGIVKVDERDAAGVDDAVLTEIRAIAAVRRATVVRLG